MSDNPPREWAARDDELLAAMSRQPYDYTFNGIKLRVDKDVFPPDIGLTTKFLATYLARKSTRSAIDIGTGTLLLALVLRQAGTPIVWASDNHPPAIKCAQENLDRNPTLKPVTIITSDLFSSIPTTQEFETIVFNQPYYPILGRPIVGLGEDGGAQIVKRFLHSAKTHLARGGEIIMPFSNIAGAENDPSIIAEATGFAVQLLDRRSEGNNWHCLFSFKDLVVK